MKGVAADVLTVLYFTATDSKIAVVHRDRGESEKFETGSVYFVKNVLKKENNIFLASEDTAITLSKRALENTIRYMSPSSARVKLP